MLGYRRKDPDVAAFVAGHRAKGVTDVVDEQRSISSMIGILYGRFIPGLIENFYRHLIPHIIGILGRRYSGDGTVYLGR